MQASVASLWLHVRASVREYATLAEQMEQIWRIHKVSLSVAGETLPAAAPADDDDAADGGAAGAGAAGAGAAGAADGDEDGFVAVDGPLDEDSSDSDG